MKSQRLASSCPKNVVTASRYSILDHFSRFSSLSEAVAG